MDKRTEQSRRNYNGIALNYDDTFDGRYTKSFKAELSVTVSLKDGDRVLDVACGNGLLLKLLSSKARIEAYGVDISDNMVAEAGKRYPDMNFHVANSSDLPFEEDFFDAITVSAAFHHFSEPRKFIAEASRVLKKGGRLYIADPYYPPVLRQIINLVLPLFKMGDVKLYNKSELAGFLDGSGYKGVTVRRFGKLGLMLEGIKE